MIKRLFPLAIFLLLTACSSEPPKCSDPQTISLLKQIVLEKLGIDAAGQEKIGKGILEKALYVENTRPSGYDEKIKKFTCDGTLIANSTSAVGVYRLPIQYESQFDDKKDHIVAVHQMAIGDLRQIDLYLAAAIAEAEKAKESAAPKLAIPPAPETVPNPPATPDPAAAPAPVVQTTSTEPAQLAEKNTVESAGICKGLDLAITFDQSECVSRKFKAADKKLNEDYATLMAALPVPRKAALKQEQIGWIKEKTAKCEQAGKEFEGGSMQPIMIIDCEVKMTEQRTGYLADFK